MYSIIIVLVACVVIFFIIKKTDPAKVGLNNNMSSSQTQNNQTGKPDPSTDIIMTVTREGEGEASKNGDLLVVNYAGYLADGTKFDASADHGQPFQFVIGSGSVIPGWEIGLLGMKKGEARQIIIPPNYAYGPQGVPGAIPPNAILTFDVELVDINPTPATSSVNVDVSTNN